MIWKCLTWVRRNLHQCSIAEDFSKGLLDVTQTTVCNQPYLVGILRGLFSGVFRFSNIDLYATRLAFISFFFLYATPLHFTSRYFSRENYDKKSRVHLGERERESIYRLSSYLWILHFYLNAVHYKKVTWDWMKSIISIH